MDIDKTEGEVNIQISVLKLLQSISATKREVKDIVTHVCGEYASPYNYDSFIETIEKIYELATTLSDRNKISL